MTYHQLHDLATVTGYPLEDLQTVHGSLPSEKQNEADIIKEYELSLHETLSVIQAQSDEIDKLQADASRCMKKG